VAPKQWIATHHDPKHSDALLTQFETVARSRLPRLPLSWAADGDVVGID
jgi:hypothetical protein